MSTLLEPEIEDRNGTQAVACQSANRVQADFAACRVKFHWFGTSKSLSTAQKSQAAESFGAEEKAISAAKRLIDTKDCLLYTSPSPRDRQKSRMPSSA